MKRISCLYFLRNGSFRAIFYYPTFLYQPVSYTVGTHPIFLFSMTFAFRNELSQARSHGGEPLLAAVVPGTTEILFSALLLAPMNSRRAHRL